MVRGRKIDRQAERQGCRVEGRQKDISSQTHREREKTDRWTDKQKQTQREGDKDRRADRQTSRVR